MVKSLQYFCLISISLLLFSLDLISNEKIKVVIFLSEDCPISQYYAKEISRIDSLFSEEIELECVFPMKSSRNETISNFKKTYNINFRTTLDTSQSLAKKYKATTTPEAVIIKDGIVIYRGSIDNKFADLGKRRNKVSNRYLIDAINQTIFNKEIITPKTKAIGCNITYY